MAFVFCFKNANKNVKQTKLENSSESIHVVNTLIMGEQQYIAGAINQYLLVLNIIASTSIMKNETKQFATHSNSYDHPKELIKRLRKVGYVIKCPP